MSKFKVKISNLSFDVEFEEIKDVVEPPVVEPPVVEPPVVEPPVVEKPPVVIPPNQPLDLDEFLSGKSGVVEIPNDVTLIRSKGMIKPNGVTAIKSSASPHFESWESTPTQLFDLSGCNEFGVVGFTPLPPKDRPIRTAFPDKELFGWKRDSVNEGRFAFINGKIIEDVDQVTYGLCRFGYSSNSSGRIYLIGKDIRHNGFNFTQIKNPHAGNLWLVLKDVFIHNPSIGGTMSHYYTPTSIKVRVKIKDGVCSIISDNTFSQVLTWAGYNNGNQRTILHFGSYVYDIRESLMIDDKNMRLDLNEKQAGDVYDNTKVVRKQIDESRQTNWVYTTEVTNQEDTKYFPEGEFDAYIAYKGNALFSDPAVVKETKFGEGYWESGIVIQSQGYGWTWYNEEFSGYLENFKGSGYFRNSSGSGRTQGLTIVNSEFENNPPKATANESMPQEAKDYISYLESL